MLVKCLIAILLQHCWWWVGGSYPLFIQIFGFFELKTFDLDCGLENYLNNWIIKNISSSCSKDALFMMLVIYDDRGALSCVFFTLCLNSLKYLFLLQFIHYLFEGCFARKKLNVKNEKLLHFLLELHISFWTYYMSTLLQSKFRVLFISHFSVKKCYPTSSREAVDKTQYWKIWEDKRSKKFYLHCRFPSSMSLHYS